MASRESTVLLRPTSVAKDLVAGSVAAIVRTTLRAPIEYAKIAITLQPSNDPSWKRYTGFGNCLARVAKEKVVFCCVQLAFALNGFRPYLPQAPDAPWP